MKAALYSLLLLMFCSAQAEETDPVRAECQRIGNKLGSVSVQDCLDLNLYATTGRSVKGAPILQKEYAPIGGVEPMGKVLLFGGVHGDEYSSVSIVFKWMKILDKHHSGLFHWRVMPLVNPDGLLRKGSTRFNANGVDLNRNFPMPNWLEMTRDYWVEKTGKNNRRYPGPSELSEPESKWLHQEIADFQPDVMVSVHAPHGIVDYDGPRQAPNKLGKLHLNLLGTYPGSLGRYAGTELNMPLVTIELPYAGIMPKPKEVSHIWIDLVRWLKQNLRDKTEWPQQFQESRQEEKNVR